MELLNAYIGNKVRELRKAKKINLAILANALGLSKTSICNIESGKHGLTSENMYAVCSILQCSPNDLFPPMQEVEIKMEEKVIERMVKKVKQVPVIIFKSR